jgi:hypothetical protein
MLFLFGAAGHHFVKAPHGVSLPFAAQKRVQVAREA